jgi:hypothetical protein
MEFILNQTFNPQPSKKKGPMTELRFKQSHTQFEYILQQKKDEVVDVMNYPSFVECNSSLKLKLKTPSFDTSLVIYIKDGSKGNISIYEENGQLIGSYKAEEYTSISNIYISQANKWYPI